MAPPPGSSLRPREAIRTDRKFYRFKYGRFSGVVVPEQHRRAAEIYVSEPYAAEILNMDSGNSHEIPPAFLNAYYIRLIALFNSAVRWLSKSMHSFRMNT